MELLKRYWSEFVLGLTAFLGLLLYFMRKQNKTVEDLKLKSEMAKTDKEVDLVEVQIKQKMDDNNNLKKTQQELNKSLESLSAKRATVEEEAKSLKHPQDVADYWDKN